MFLPVLVYTGAGSNIYIYIYIFIFDSSYIYSMYIYIHTIYVFTNFYTYIYTHHIFLDIILTFNPTDCQGLFRVGGRFGSGTNGTARTRWTTIGSPFCCLCTFQVREVTGEVVHFVGKGLWSSSCAFWNFLGICEVSSCGYLLWVGHVNVGHVKVGQPHPPEN